LTSAIDKNKLKSEVRAVTRGVGIAWMVKQWVLRWCLKQLSDGEVLMARSIGSRFVELLRYTY